MRPLQGAVALAVLCLVCLTGPSLSFVCDAPVWDDTAGPNPFPEREGKVVLVALLKGYCRYCIRQAGKMNALKNQLIAEGFPDIDMLIINGGENRSRDLVDNLINASPIPVIQDTRERVLYGNVFRASKDDFLVYDRCNQAAIYIPHPYSNLDRTLVKQILKAVHMGRHNCYCALDYPPVDPDDQMQGDDPGVWFYQAHSMGSNILNCPPRDRQCRRFRRIINMQANGVSRAGRRRNLGSRRASLRRIQDEMRQMEEDMINPRGNQDQDVTGMQHEGTGIGFGGGSRRRFGGGGRRRFGNRRRMGMRGRHGNSRVRDRVNSRLSRPAGSV